MGIYYGKSAKNILFRGPERIILFLWPDTVTKFSHCIVSLSGVFQSLFLSIEYLIVVTAMIYPSWNVSSPGLSVDLANHNA